MGTLIGALFKALLEVITSTFVDLVSKPDVVKPDPEPVLDRIVDPDTDALVNQFGGLTL